MKHYSLILLSLALTLLSFEQLKAQSSSIEFDGSSGHINLGNNFNFEYDSIFTVEAWIKCKDAVGVHQVITKITPPDYRGWGIQVEDGDLLAYLISDYNSSNGIWYRHEDTDFSDGKWHHIAVSFNGDLSATLYVDGVSVRKLTQEVVTETILDTANLIVGAYLNKTKAEETWKGMIDEVRIWNDSRTAKEIKDNMHCPMTGSEENLIGYWDMEEGTGVSTEDKAGDVDGSLQGGFSWSMDVGMDCTGGIGILNPPDQLRVYPNPSTSSCVVSSNTPFSDAQIEVYNLQGTLMQVKTRVTGTEVELNTAPFKPGMYVIHIIDKSTKNFVRLMVE